MTSTAPIATSTTPAAPSQAPGPGTFGQWLSTGNNRWIAAGGGLLAVALIVVFLLWGVQRKEAFAARALDEARTTAEAGNLPLAASQFQKLITTYAGTDAADEAVMALNQVRLINGQAQLAAGGLTEFIKSGPKAKYSRSGPGATGIGSPELEQAARGRRGVRGRRQGGQVPVPQGRVSAPGRTGVRNGRQAGPGGDGLPNHRDRLQEPAVLYRGCGPACPN